MDYVVGSVAALISGNVTPNRPKLIRRALTPTKHQPSPNVTPKSELQVDRSIFLSPTLQKKKAIVKKSPKRIFQNPELDTTENEEDTSPKADKVKKHLKDDLEADPMGKSNKKSPKKRQDSSFDSSATLETSKTDNSVVTTESSPKKKKKRISESNIHNQSDTSNVDHAMDIPEKEQTPTKSPKKKNQSMSIADIESSEQNKESTTNDITENTEEVTNNSQDNKKKKNKKRKNKNSETNNVDDKENKTEIIETQTQPTKKKKNKKNKKKQQNQVTDESIQQKTTEIKITTTETVKKSKKKNKKQSQTEGEKETTTTMEVDNEITETVNPNAITEQDSDSEHESDDEIHSDNEETNKELLESQENNENSDESDDDEDEKETKQKLSKKEQKDKKKKGDGETTEVKEKEINLEDEVKKTIFVGNVLLTKKTRKEIKKIFRKYGEIKTVRIRFVPVKDARVTPKMAVIKNELHPERSTVNVYVKFADEASVEQALAENNTVLNGHHLRVTRTTTTGAEHDPRLAVFVGNMPFGMEDDQLRGVFEKCGEIESVRIIRDKKTNAGKGFGYVNFTSKDGVELALNLSEEDLTVKNRIMRVKRSTQVLGQKGSKQNRSEQNRPPHNRPGQNRPPHNRPGRNGPPQNRSGQNRPGQNRPGQNRPGQNRPWQNRPGQNEPAQESEDGAHRRIMNKRKHQESSDGPPNKVQKNIPQPNNRENKKQRKEFVGMTSEKKKKHKFDKGQKKKKVLSEILTKKRT